MKWLTSIGLSGTVLALFAAITSVAIGWTYLGTKAQIDFEVRRAEARQLLEIFPPDTHDNDIIDDMFEVAAETALLGIREPRQGYRVRRGEHCHRRHSAPPLPETVTAVTSALWWGVSSGRLGGGCPRGSASGNARARWTRSTCANPTGS